MSQKILLLDGHSILFRGFYALPLLSNADGDYTNAIYGFMSVFLRLYDEEKPDKIAVAFDLHEPTFRHKMFDGYKGTRKPTPPEFIPQVPALINLLKIMGVPVVTCSGYEADDVLGTLATQAETLGWLPVIVSGDRDLLQLASDNTKIRISKKGGILENYYAPQVKEKYGVTPKEFIDMKALMGDSSDNIPGVPGIGEATARKIIVAYSTVENAIVNSAKVKPKKASQNLALYSDQALLNKELSTIKLDVPIEFDFLTKWDPQGMWNADALAEVKKLNFKFMFSRFFGLQRPEIEQTKQTKQTEIEQSEEFEQMTLN